MKIVINDLFKSYDKNVFNGINLDLSGCKSVALIGPSGSGKSTLLRLMSAIEGFDSGRIFINDVKINNETKKNFQKHIGFVFQKHNLFPHLTLKRNITIILEKVKKYSIEESNKIAEDLLKKLQLEDQMNKLPKNVSGGQAQRASIARALATNPDIMFLDEPTASLDPILTYEVLQAVKKLRSSGKDFLFVTHEMSFVRDFADYVIYINNGKIVEHGTVDIIDNPKTVELKNFVSIVK